jgi:S1-C subfamily serine protease
MDALVGLVRALVPVTLTLHVRVPSQHASVPVLGDERMGTAALVDPQGLLLTVTYVVMGGQEIEATFPDGRRFPAEIVAQDFESGIAVLSIPVRDRPAASLGRILRPADGVGDRGGGGGPGGTGLPLRDPRGDVIVAVNLREVETRPELYQEMWKHEAGAPLSFSILRKGRRTTVEVIATDRAEFYR